MSILERSSSGLLLVGWSRAVLCREFDDGGERAQKDAAAATNHHREAKLSMSKPQWEFKIDLRKADDNDDAWQGAQKVASSCAIIIAHTTTNAQRTQRQTRSGSRRTWAKRITS